MKKTKIFIFLLALCTLHSQAFAQTINEPACLERLSNEALYKKHKKESYARLVPGKDDWIFRSYADFRQEFAFTPETITGFVKLSEALKAQGTELVVAFPPTRGIVAAEYLPDGPDFDPKIALAAYKAAIKQMQKSGLHFVGVDNFGNDTGFFRRKDHHWTVKGARIMAENIAKTIKADIPTYKSIEKKPYETISSGTYEFNNRFDDMVELLCDIKGTKGKDEAVSTSVKGEAANDLFGDQAPPEIILVGTSNSKAKNVKSNFDGALQDLLQADVGNEAMSGAGVDHPLLAFLNSERFKTSPPKIIIWEIPGNYRLKGLPDLFNQAIAMSAGDCGDDAITSFGPVTIDNKGVRLTSGLAKNKLLNGRDYLFLDFDRPVKKKFKIQFGYNDQSKSKKSFKFKHSKHYPNEGKFYVVAPIDKKDLIDEVHIHAPTELFNSKVEGRFCRLPKNVTGIKY